MEIADKQHHAQLSHDKISLKTDAQLCALLQEFSMRVQSRAKKLIDAKTKLEQKIRATDHAAERAFFSLTSARAHKPLCFDIAEDICQTHNVKNKSTIDERNIQPSGCASVDTEVLLREEEYAAKMHGIAALKYFYSHSKSNDKYYESDHYFTLDEEENETPQYYESAEADVFNQRPIPFIIGSKEFMISQDGGIGSDVDSNDSDAF